MSQVVGSSTKPTAQLPESGARILVVDDEQYMCDVCTRTLRRAGHDVVATTDAEQALTILRQDLSFDLILTDIRMPSVSGLELAHQARLVDPSIAIIIMTGHASMENLLQAVRRGAAEVLCKPFELEQLRIAVEQALHHRRLLQDSLRLRSIERLLQSSEAINASLDRDQLIQIVLQTARENIGCETSFLLLYDGRRLGVVYSAEANASLLQNGHELAEAVARTNQSLVVTDNAPLCSYADKSIYRGLAAPLRAHGQTLGVLMLCDDRQVLLRSGVQESIVLLANQAGVALRNAVLYGELQTSNQRLQELDRLKSEFISIASHELRTPLSIVLGYTMMVRDQVHNEQHEYLQRVLDNAQRIKDIVDDMVNLRHLETGELKLSLHPHYLQSLVSQAVERMLPAATRKRQQLSAHLPMSPVTFMVDSEKYLLVLGHLISNAIKFTAEGESVVIRGDIWHWETEKGTSSSDIISLQDMATTVPEPLWQDWWVVLQVCDTGIGIPEREQPRIFERFYQVADSLTREHGGTGLGLAIVRELVVLQGGIVWVTSTEARGSIFSVALPYHAHGDETSGDRRSV